MVGSEAVRATLRQIETVLKETIAASTLLRSENHGAAHRPDQRALTALGARTWRLIITGDDAAEMAVLGPLRAGITFRF